MAIKTYAKSVQGYSHIKTNKVCQDYALDLKDDNFVLLAVADGHGSKSYFRSDVGAKLACEVSREVFKNAMNEDEFAYLLNKDYELALRNIARSILIKWQNAVIEHFIRNSITDEEEKYVNKKLLYEYEFLNTTNADEYAAEIKQTYGAALVVVVITPEYWCAIRNGDCECISLYGDGSYKTDIPWNDKCIMNVTTSICSDNAINEFRYYYSTGEMPKAIYLCSDGLPDSFKDKVYYNKVLSDYVVSNLNKENAIEVISDKLDIALSQISEEGSGDDMTLAFWADNCNDNFIQLVCDKSEREFNAAVEIDRQKEAEKKAKELEMIKEADRKMREKAKKAENKTGKDEDEAQDTDSEINEKKQPEAEENKEDESKSEGDTSPAEDNTDGIEKCSTIKSITEHHIVNENNEKMTTYTVTKETDNTEDSDQSNDKTIEDNTARK